MGCGGASADQPGFGVDPLERDRAREADRFRIRSGLTALLAAIVQRTSKRSIDELARDELFAPLGIEDVELMASMVESCPRSRPSRRCCWGVG
jgi:CubicO group peptidase (beta-lactamase class C family)